MRAILTYHSIDDSGSVLSIDPQTFRSQVEWLAASRVRVLSVAKIAECRRPRGALETAKDANDGNAGDVDATDAHDAVALTFDDGFENFATHAWPILRDHGLAATVFVVTDSVGDENTWEPPDGFPRRPLMNWPLIARVHAEGADVGSHSHTHRSLPGLSDAGLHDEIGASSERIRNELGASPAAFAYPYGEHDARVIAAVAGRYRYACTTEMQTLGSAAGAHALPRIDAYYLRRPGAIQSWGSMGFAARLQMHAAARDLRRRFTKRGARRGGTSHY